MILNNLDVEYKKEISLSSSFLNLDQRLTHSKLPEKALNALGLRIVTNKKNRKWI